MPKLLQQLGIFLLPLLVLSACQPQQERVVTRGFYYWKTNLNLSDFAKKNMAAVNSEYLYTRFFDVVLGPKNKPMPSAIINFGESLPQQTIIPVVYITPEALNAMNWHNLDYYARNIVKLIRQKAEKININPPEIQIDCDWTASNKTLYFTLLQKIAQQDYAASKTLSATLRLHQIKYDQKTGIPPVDKGLLMVYNMNDLTDPEVKNSIISLQTTKQYLSHLADYPLSLDVALPIYSWTLLFEKKQMKGVKRAFKGILRKLDDRDLKNNELFKKQGYRHFLVQKDSLYKGYALQKGQLIRFEEADFETVHQVAQYLSTQLQANRLRILLYQCDSINFKRFSTHEMEKIFTDFN